MTLWGVIGHLFVILTKIIDVLCSNTENLYKAEFKSSELVCSGVKGEKCKPGEYSDCGVVNTHHSCPDLQGKKQSLEQKDFKERFVDVCCRGV